MSFTLYQSITLSDRRYHFNGLEKYEKKLDKG
jgi:hypothetical protein